MAMARSVDLHTSCRITSRRAPREVTTSMLASSTNAQDAPRSCGQVAPGNMSRANFDKVWATRGRCFNGVGGGGNLAKRGLPILASIGSAKHHRALHGNDDGPIATARRHKRGSPEDRGCGALADDVGNRRTTNPSPAHQSGTNAGRVGGTRLRRRPLAPTATTGAKRSEPMCDGDGKRTHRERPKGTARCAASGWAARRSLGATGNTRQPFGGEPNINQ